MQQRTPDRRALRGVRVFLVQLTGYESVAILLKALGADVQTFTSLYEADLAAIPLGMTILAARLLLADHEHDVDPVTFVVRGFGVVGLLRPELLQPSFADRFVEVHRGYVAPPDLCKSIIRAAGLTSGSLEPQLAHGRPFRIAI